MRNRVTLFLGAVCLIAVSGCGSSSNNTEFASIRKNLTPELEGLTGRRVDNQRNFAVSENQDLRMLNDDIRRAFFLDHPSRLSPYPILYTNGNPN